MSFLPGNIQDLRETGQLCIPRLQKYGHPTYKMLEAMAVLLQQEPADLVSSSIPVFKLALPPHRLCHSKPQLSA